ncbi:TetR/AcrR family transcriptional regulator [Gordonia sp. CPCC 205515]|uniref:TetR/AcrR family transcriptional regulator n=1 Tax=Gordonia sp. CPCC 205515 TaxID=3140791 RepID=UPI003AF3A2AD
MPESSPSRRGSRLTVDDWLDAAMRLLISEGVGAIKISRLCRQLGVTKGSFYWHFTDIAALMTALADHCRRVQADAMETLEGLGSLPPVERIRTMGVLVSDTRRRSVEAAVRAWAETDPHLAKSVIALDSTVFDVAHDAFMELGFDEQQAHARATTLVYVGIGYMAGSEHLDIATDEDKRILVEILTRI